MAKTVLITGASGFIATHTIDAFLRKGYNVRGTVRSEKSGSSVLKTHSKYPGQLSLAIVPDIAAPNAFDEAVKGVDGVSDTAYGAGPSTNANGHCRSSTKHRRLS
jgi:nucleoside-diphosphate-sugar epimerase